MSTCSSLSIIMSIAIVNERTLVCLNAKRVTYSLRSNIQESLRNSNIQDPWEIHERLTLFILPRAGSGAVSKWVICACDSRVDFGTV